MTPPKGRSVMESKISEIVAQADGDGRQLSITEFAHNAGVVRDLGMAARCVLTARDMAAERRRAAALDRAHHLRLIEAHMPAVGFTPSRTVVAENVRDLQSWSSHGRRYGAGGSSRSRLARLRRGVLRPSSGLSILAIIPIATRL